MVLPLAMRGKIQRNKRLLKEEALLSARGVSSGGAAVRRRQSMTRTGAAEGADSRSKSGLGDGRAGPGGAQHNVYGM